MVESNTNPPPAEATSTGPAAEIYENAEEGSIEWTHERLKIGLAERFGSPEWLFIPELPDSSGYGRTRTIDGFAFNLYPSRGCEFIACECKASRSDFLSELKKPWKAEGIAKYCDRFYLVVADKAFVKPGELPATWGLIAPRGRKLVIVTEAPKLTAARLERGFVAAILQRCTTVRLTRTVLNKARQEAKEQAEWQTKNNLEHYQAESKRMAERIDAFEKASGIRLDDWNAERDGEAVKLAKLILSKDGVDVQQRLKNLVRITQEAEAMFAETLAFIEGGGAK